MSLFRDEVSAFLPPRESLRLIFDGVPNSDASNGSEASMGGGREDLLVRKIEGIGDRITSVEC